MKDFPKQLGILLIAVWAMCQLPLSAQPTIEQLVGINIKPQQETAKAIRFGTARYFHLSAEDIGNAFGGEGKLPFRGQ